MSKVIAVSMMKDEQDVAASTVLHLLDEYVDEVIVADNGSTDGTRDALADIAYVYPQVTVLDDPEVGYYQSRKMTALAAMAAERGATWIIPFDADEVWYAHADRLAVVLRSLPSNVSIVGARLFNHFTTKLDEDPKQVKIPFQRMVYRQVEPGALPKVCFRWRADAEIQQGNHSVIFHNGTPEVVDATVELRHFPYRSFEQFKSKAQNGAKAYAATDLPHDVGAHWREYGAILDRYGEDALREVYDRWFSFTAPITEGLIFDPAPFRRWH